MPVDFTTAVLYVFLGGRNEPINIISVRLFPFPTLVNITLEGDEVEFHLP